MDLIKKQREINPSVKLFQKNKFIKLSLGDGPVSSNLVKPTEWPIFLRIPTPIINVGIFAQCSTIERLQLKKNMTKF